MAAWNWIAHPICPPVLWKWSPVRWYRLSRAPKIGGNTCSESEPNWKLQVDRFALKKQSTRSGKIFVVVMIAMPLEGTASTEIC